MVDTQLARIVDDSRGCRKAREVKIIGLARSDDEMRVKRMLMSMVGSNGTRHTSSSKSRDNSAPCSSQSGMDVSPAIFLPVIARSKLSGTSCYSIHLFIELLVHTRLV
jgi:hypothetical protein